MIVAYIIGAICVLIDQLTKWLLYGKSCSLIGDFLWLEPGFNTGASFSILSNATTFLIIFSIPVIAMMNYLIISNKVSKSKFFKISIGIILGGTIGNFIDRIAFGGVRDFIYLKSINFAIFNFADIFLNIGVYMLIGYIIYAAVIEYKKVKVQSEKDVKPKVLKQTEIMDQILNNETDNKLDDFESVDEEKNVEAEKDKNETARQENIGSNKKNKSQKKNIKE